MRLLKWAGAGAAGVLAILLVAFGFVYFQTQSRINKTYEVNPDPVRIAASTFVAGEGSLSADGRGSDDGGARAGSMPEVLAWGKHLAVTRGCTDCHGEDLGGAVFADEMPVMRLSASNLTPGGPVSSYTDVDWVRSIRHGIRPDGKPLLFMPSYEYYYMGDQDLAALIGYLKSLPAIAREKQANRVGPLGRVLFMAGQLPLVPAEMIQHDGPRPTAPPRGATVAYGAYLAVGCTGCHGPEFSGGPIPGVPPDWPPALNISADPETGIGNWSREDFFRALRQGRRPDGTELRAEYMPWPNFGQLHDDEMEALWMYLQTVPARAFGEK
ncbi:c-type cytochrome [Gemmatimonadota bacterium]